MATPVQMPKQGNSVEECLLVEWTVKEGEEVKTEDLLCSIETDKATFEVMAPVDGILLKTFFPAGELVPVLTNIAVIGKEGEDVSTFEPNIDNETEEQHVDKSTPAEQAATKPTTTPAPILPNSDNNKNVSPRAKKLAEAKGIDATRINGSGAKGRVISGDIEDAAKAGLAMTSSAIAEASKSGMVAGISTGIGGRVRRRDLVTEEIGKESNNEPIEIPYKGIRKLIGDRMLASLQEHAQLTLNSSADATSLLNFRKNIKALGEDSPFPNITLNDMICAVVSWTLPNFPELNALFSKSAEKVVQYKQVNLSLAVDTDRGLMVPTINNADTMALSEISRNIKELASQCKKGSINPDLLSGGTFTITNLGTLGIESFTPVLNSPQVAILGVCSIEQKAIPDAEKGFAFQPTMGLSLTIDHQVVDGAPAAKFLKAVVDGLENFEFTVAKQAI